MFRSNISIKEIYTITNTISAMDVGEYICRRLLETECGFQTVYSETLEPHFTALDYMFNSCKDEMNRKLVATPFPIAKDFVELKKHYISLLRGIFEPGIKSDEMNVNAIATVFLITRCFVQYHNAQRHGDFAMALCFWMNDFLQSCDVKWDHTQDIVFYKRRIAIARMNNVVYAIFSWGPVAIFNKFLNLYYRFLSWT